MQSKSGTFSKCRGFLATNPYVTFYTTCRPLYDFCEFRSTHQELGMKPSTTSGFLSPPLSTTASADAAVVVAAAAAAMTWPPVVMVARWL